MKTYTKIAVIFTIALLFSLNSYSNPIFEEEAYVNDIPFDTETIAIKALYEMAMSKVFYLEEEEYINDIPFNTDSIYRDCICKKAMKTEFEMEEETYIDDIPFDTHKIVQETILSVRP